MPDKGTITMTKQSFDFEAHARETGRLRSHAELAAILSIIFGLAALAVLAIGQFA